MPIKLISASAGSGKTYTLTMELADALVKGVQPEGVLATTFTNKAAGELTERVRLRLLGSGLWDQAQRMPDGYIGTVNSVCGQILKDFAFDMGLSPIMDVLPDGEDQAIYKKAIFSVVERYAPSIEPVATRLQWEDWRETVKMIGDAARANGIAPGDLRPSGEASWRGIRRILPCPNRSGARMLDNNLLSTMVTAIGALKTSVALTGIAKTGMQTMEDCLKKLRGNNRLSWSEWVKLSKLDVGKTFAPLISPVIAQAQKHTEHPRLHSDIKAMIFKCFACAAEAMKAYAEFKAAHGLIDFVDQESLCLAVLKQPHVRQFLQTRLELALVDEFQDTSPIELAVFLQLATIAKDSVWVGDQKQAIYGFRGADPSLMDSIINGIIQQGSLQVLPDSYRSRPALVDFTNEVFSAAFGPLGIPRTRVCLNAKRQDSPGQTTALELWYLAATATTAKGDPKALTLGEEAQALAVGVADMLRRRQTFIVFDRRLEEYRPLRGEDVAILCRTNDRCTQMAEALENVGVKATVPRPGLLSQPECVLALATLRYLASDDDTVAAAEIVHFTGNGTGPGAWFTNWLAVPNPPGARPWQSHPLISRLDAVRRKLLRLTPTEAFQLALDTVRLEHTIMAWGEIGQRLANVEKMRVLAREYEDRCLVQRSAGTPAGLVTFFIKELGGKSDTQAEGKDEEAVRVLTYHKAKGLEWPVVILFDLHSGEKANPFGVHVESRHPAADGSERDTEAAFSECDEDLPQDGGSVNDPLAGRWIRFWPWPYGKQREGTGLDQSIDNSMEQQSVTRTERKELVRLLYVGMTRARDYLMFAVASKRRGSNATAWLDFLKDSTGAKIINLPNQNGAGGHIGVCGKQFPVTVWTFKPAGSQGLNNQPTAYLYPILEKTTDFPPAHFTPSSQDYHLDGEILPEPIRIGNHLPIVGNPDMSLLGEAIHSFMAVDNVGEPQEKRLQRAEAILKRWQMTGLAPDSLVEASNRLWAFIGSTFGASCPNKREWPVNLRVGCQKAEGWIDLLLEPPDGFVIIDHKSFPGTEEKCLRRAEEYAPQVALYKRAVELATGRAVIDTFIHLPVSGLMVRLKGL